MQTLTSVARYTTKKDGSPLVTSKGRPYTSVRIKTADYGDKIISGFGNADNANWKAGDTVDIEVKPNGDYLNFEMPKKADMGPAAGNGATAELKNILTLQVMPMLQNMAKDIAIMTEKMKLSEPYPEMNETNDAHSFVTKGDVPF